MGKFISIPGMAPSGGEGKMNSNSGTPRTRPNPTREQLQDKYKDYYKNRGETMTSPFVDVGEKMRFGGDDAVVRHVERHADGSQDLTVQRSVRGNSGTYKVTVEPGKDRSQVVTKAKRTFD